MNNSKYYFLATLLISSTVLAGQTEDYIYVTNNIEATQGTLANKPLDLHIAGVESDGVTPKEYILPPKTTQQVYLWHDGSLNSPNVSYTAYYAGTTLVVPDKILTSIKYYYDGANQQFPCNTSASISYVNEVEKEYQWNSLACK